MADEPIAPIDRVEPAAPTARPQAPPPPQRPAAPTPPGGQPPVGLDAATVHEQIQHPVRSPQVVDGRATVHDAALHGDRLARAIDDRAQALAGAAASAGSGQSAVVRVDDVVEPDERPDDPLARVTAIDEDPDRRDPRSRREQLDDADLDP